MHKTLRWTCVLAFAGALLSGCGDDGDGSAGTGAMTGGAGSGGFAGAGGAGAGPSQTCGPEAAVCESDGLICDFERERCVECLSAADCTDDSETCVDGSCTERLCTDDGDCPPGMPECTDSGCAPCSGEVVTEDGEEGECYSARGPNGTAPTGTTNKPDGCSAERFVAVIEDLGYEVPAEGPERQDVADNPLKRVTEGVCTAQFGNRGLAISACELHDYCYSICGSSRVRCDLEFANRLLDTCRGAYLAGPCRTACDSLAVLYASVATAIGKEPYLNAQDRNCSCCPEPSIDGICDESIGETVDNASDCEGDFPNGADCLTNGDCDSGYCGVHGECAPLVCIANADCPSGICNWGVCLARPLEPGSGCSTDEACTSGDCSVLGVCIECQRDEQCAASQHCNLVGDCIDDLGNNAICTANAECLSNICSAGFCAECVRDDQCAASKHCNLVGDCIDDLGNNAICTANAECLSNICSAGFCAQCVRDSQCAASKHCNLVGDCVNDLGNGSPCTANGECRSGTCVGVCI